MTDPLPSHRAPSPIDLPCPVCRVPATVECRALDFGPLPGGHGERGEPTPLYDALMRPTPDTHPASRESEQAAVGAGSS